MVSRAFFAHSTLPVSPWPEAKRFAIWMKVSLRNRTRCLQAAEYCSLRVGSSSRSLNSMKSGRAPGDSGSISFRDLPLEMLLQMYVHTDPAQLLCLRVMGLPLSSSCSATGLYEIMHTIIPHFWGLVKYFVIKRWSEWI